MSQAGHILVLDRERRVGDTITAVLRRRGWSCDTLGDARQAAEALRHEVPDVLVVDLGVAAYRKLLARRTKPPLSVPVIVATGRPSLTIAVEALRLGAVAFLRKPIRSRELVRSTEAAMEKARALRGIARARRMIGVWTEWLRLVDVVLSTSGPAAMPPGLLDGITRHENSPSRSNEAGEWSTPARTLSLREREALFAFTSGLRPRQIARALGVTIHTARAHLKAVMRKLGVHSQTELLDRVREPWFADDGGPSRLTGRSISEAVTAGGARRNP
jgi:FixJ family two-component response regulator